MATHDTTGRTPDDPTGPPFGLDPADDDVSGTYRPLNTAEGFGSDGAGQEPLAGSPLGGDSFSFDDAETPPGGGSGRDFLEGEDDGRYRPVRVNRRLVLGGLLIAGAATLLGLLVLSGGSDDARTVEAGRPEAAAPEFLNDGLGDPYAVTDPAAEGTYAVPDAQAADPYGSAYSSPAYAGAPYAGTPYASDYGATASVGPLAAPSAPYAFETAGSGVDPFAGFVPAGDGVPSGADAFARALLSPVRARAQGATPTPRPAPGRPLDPELQREVDEIRRVAEQFAAPAPAVAAPEASRPEGGSAEGIPATVAVPSGGWGRGEASESPARDPREAFLARTSALAPTRYGVRADVPETAFVLQAGTVVPAALVTGLDSELPGAVLAQVTRDVYDSAELRHVLIPRGSRLVGEYDDQLAYGQNRALVAWTRLLFPDGRSVALPGLRAGDLQGYTGLRGRVDRHFAQTFASAVMLATVGAGAQLALPDAGQNTGVGQSPQEVIAGQIALEISRVAAKVAERGLDVRPTLRIAPGHRFTVFLARDLAFAGPYRSAPSGARFTRPSVPAAGRRPAAPRR